MYHCVIKLNWYVQLLAEGAKQQGLLQNYMSQLEKVCFWRLHCDNVIVIVCMLLYCCLSVRLSVCVCVCLSVCLIARVGRPTLLFLYSTFHINFFSSPRCFSTFCFWSSSCLSASPMESFKLRVFPTTCDQQTVAS